MSRFIALQSGIYHFRRRVPDDVAPRIGRREIYRSLHTSRLSVAVHRARKLAIATDEIFEMARDRNFTDEQLKAAARASFEKLNKQHVEQIALIDVSDLQDEIETYARRRLLWTDASAGEHWQMSGSTMNGLEASWSLNLAGFDGYQATAKDKLAYQSIVIAELTKKVQERYNHYYSEPSSRNRNDLPPGPLFSIKFDEYLTDLAEKRAAKKLEKKNKNIINRKSKKDTENDSEDHMIKQSRWTGHLLMSLVGDRSIDSYTRKMVRDFKAKLCEIPSSFGKGNNKDVHVAIDNADPDQKFMAGKTIKRHFSALSVFWADIFDQDLVDTNIFRGHTFDLSDSEDRKPWKNADFLRFFADPIWRDQSVQ